jgi:hypothetical protein
MTSPAPIQAPQSTPRIAPILIYKPTKSNSGRALKVDLNVTPEWVATEKGGFYKTTKQGQGCFVELAPQTGPQAFDWTKVVRCKLGIVDLSKWLTSYRELRLLGHPLPDYFQPQSGGKATLNLFHKFGEGSTVITYEFQPARSILKVSKSKDVHASIALNLDEELLLEWIFREAMSTLLTVGLR